MYVSNFITSSYIALFSYYVDLNNSNSIIVNLKYGMQSGSKILLLRNILQNSWFYKFYNLFLNLKIKNKISLYFKAKKLSFRNNLKKILNLWFIKIRKCQVSLNVKKFIKLNLIKHANKILNFNLKCYLIFYKKMVFNVFKKFFRSNSFINVNTRSLFLKKNKLLKFVLNKLLKKQVLSSGLLLDNFLGLNLHPLFLRRFRFRFLKALQNRKFHFNLNNYFFKFNFSVLFKLLNVGVLYLYLLSVKSINKFYNLLYTNASTKLLKFLNLDFNSVYFNKFKKYFLNLKDINYVNISFKFKRLRLKKKIKKKIRKYLKKFRKLNFLNFSKLVFLKLLIFLFLYWLNNLIVLLKQERKGALWFVWFKPIKFLFKSYIWRRKLRFYYLRFDIINQFIFFNYKNKLTKLNAA